MPRKKPEIRTVQTSLYIPEDLLKEVQKVRQQMGLQRDNYFYIDAIKEKLAREKKKK